MSYVFKCDRCARVHDDAYQDVYLVKVVSVDRQGRDNDFDDKKAAKLVCFDCAHVVRNAINTYPLGMFRENV